VLVNRHRFISRQIQHFYCTFSYLLFFSLEWWKITWPDSNGSGSYAYVTLYSWYEWICIYCCL